MSEAWVSATNQDVTVEITDGSHSYYIDLEPGDHSRAPGIQEPVINLTRGRINPLAGGAPDMRMNDEAPASGSFTARLRSLSSTTEATLMDLSQWLASDDSALHYVRANWTSTHPFSDVRTITLKFHHSGIYRGVVDQAEVYDYCNLRLSGHTEGNPTSLSIDWTAGVVKARVE